MNQEFGTGKKKADRKRWTGESGENDAGKPIILGQTLKEETYVAIHNRRAVSEQSAEPSADSESTKESTSTGDSIGMDSSVKTAGLRVSRQPSVRTTPLAYMPQALGFTLARILGLNSISLLYLGRFF